MPTCISVFYASEVNLKLHLISPYVAKKNKKEKKENHYITRVSRLGEMFYNYPALVLNTFTTQGFRQFEQPEVIYNLFNVQIMYLLKSKNK